jgi:energy-coupling factor transporter ATP-binding protein EcfA2
MNVLVGPNNSGKSTIIGAFRALFLGLRRAASKSAERLDGPDSEVRPGYTVPPELLPISIENVHTDYSEEDTTVTFRLSNGASLLLFFPREGGCRLFGKCQKRVPQNPTEFRAAFPLELGLAPVLGPVEHNEPLLEERTVQRDLATHRASRHFRNYWYHNPEGFDDFAALVARTWPGMVVKPVEHVQASGNLAMFCEENRIARELYWVGSGFQIWCQLLTHISRSRGAGLFIVDEPEIYLHPDLQRRLVGLLRNAGPQILLATHSTEIIAEAEPTDIVMIDKARRSGIRLRPADPAQAAFEHLGSAQNVVHTQIARWRKALFFEGGDLRLLRWFAGRAGALRLSQGVDFASIPIGGYSAWDNIPHQCKGILESLGETVLFACVLDRDYRCEEEIEFVTAALSTAKVLVHIHKRKEIENYLLLPGVLQRAVAKAVQGRRSEGGAATASMPSVAQMLEEITGAMEDEVFGELIANRDRFLRRTGPGVDSATVTKETLRRERVRWSSLDSRLELVPGKKVLSALNNRLQKEVGITLSAKRIIDEVTAAEIPEDLKQLLEKLNDLIGSRAMTGERR